MIEDVGTGYISRADHLFCSTAPAGHGEQTSYGQRRCGAGEKKQPRSNHDGVLGSSGTLGIYEILVPWDSWGLWGPKPDHKDMNTSGIKEDSRDCAVGIRLLVCQAGVDMHRA